MATDDLDFYDKKKNCGMFDTVRYRSKNPLMRKLMLSLTDEIVRQAHFCMPKTILDIGCGEGFNTFQVGKMLTQAKITAIDRDSGCIVYAQENNRRDNIQYVADDLFALQSTLLNKKEWHNNKYDLVICTEVLEHLENYEQAIKNLCELSKQYILISVPDEPYFRIANFLRGKYITRLGSSPDHVNHWTKGKIIALLGCFGRIVSIKTSGFWNVFLLEKNVRLSI